MGWRRLCLAARRGDCVHFFEEMDLGLVVGVGLVGVRCARLVVGGGG